MKPCDCGDMYTVLNELNESGVKYNDYGITVQPLSVLLESKQFVIKIPQHIFKRFAEWYLEDQIKEK